MVCKKIFIGLIVFLFLTSFVWSEEYDHYDYWYYSGDSISCAWDQASGAVEYEAKLYHVEQQVPVALGRTPQLQIQFICPRSGHYFLKVKTIGESEETEWSSSDDPSVSTVNSQPRSWWIYCHVAPPTGSEIE